MASSATVPPHVGRKRPARGTASTYALASGKQRKRAASNGTGDCPIVACDPVCGAVRMPVSPRVGMVRRRLIISLPSGPSNPDPLGAFPPPSCGELTESLLTGRGENATLPSFDLCDYNTYVKHQNDQVHTCLITSTTAGRRCSNAGESSPVSNPCGMMCEEA